MEGSGSAHEGCCRMSLDTHQTSHITMKAGAQILILQAIESEASRLMKKVLVVYMPPSETTAKPTPATAMTSIWFTTRNVPPSRRTTRAIQGARPRRFSPKTWAEVVANDTSPTKTCRPKSTHRRALKPGLGVEKTR